MAYDFAGVAYEFHGGLRLSTFHGGLRRLMTAAWGSIRYVGKFSKTTSSVRTQSHWFERAEWCIVRRQI